MIKNLMKSIRDRYVVRLQKQITTLRDNHEKNLETIDKQSAQIKQWKGIALRNVKRWKIDEVESLVELSKYIAKLHQTIANINRRPRNEST